MGTKALSNGQFHSYCVTEAHHKSSTCVGIHRRSSLKQIQHRKQLANVSSQSDLRGGQLCLTLLVVHHILGFGGGFLAYFMAPKCQSDFCVLFIVLCLLIYFIEDNPLTIDFLHLKLIWQKSLGTSVLDHDVTTVLAQLSDKGTNIQYVQTPV